MSFVLQIIREWSAFFALVLLGWLLRSGIGAVFARVKKRVDAKVPDDLPVGAGEWLKARDDAQDLRVLAAPGKLTDVDMFIPSARTIVLSREVYAKRDASFWAVAAHELGHSLVYRRTPLLHWPLLAGRIVLSSATAIATFLVFANVLYARRDVDAVAFTLLEASLGAYVLVLVDEALASIIAIGILARDGRVDRRGLVAAVTLLLAAFMTYLGGFVGQLVLVLRRDFVIAQIERHRHFTPGAPMGGPSFVLVSLLSIFLVVLSAHAIVRELKKREVTTVEEVSKERFRFVLRELGRGAVGAAIVWLVWDRPLGPLLPLVCVAGLLASSAFVQIAVWLATLVVRLAAALVALPFYVVVYVTLGLFFGRDSKGSDESTASAAPPGPDSKRFYEAWEAMRIDLHNRPPWNARAAAIAFPALHIAFVVGIYVEMLAR